VDGATALALTEVKGWRDGPWRPKVNMWRVRSSAVGDGAAAMLQRSAGQRELTGVAPDGRRFDQHAFARDDALAIEAERVAPQRDALERLFDILQRWPTNFDGSEGRDIVDFPSRPRAGPGALRGWPVRRTLAVQLGALAERPPLHDVQTLDEGLQIFRLYVVHGGGPG
jgi:hypothetical protein